MTHHSGAAETGRRGHTLVELLVSMTAATFLMAGLGSCLMISIRAFDGNIEAMTRSRASEVQEDLVADISQAKSFITRSSDSVTMRVADRDSDGVDETLTYAWSGLPDAELRFVKNGSETVTVLENVQHFNLDYLSRLIPGSPLPPVDPSDWGQRWKLGQFGYDTIYGADAYYQPSTAAVRATLLESGTLKSISAYFVGSNSNVRMALYDADWLGRPRNLLATTDAKRVSAPGWLALETPPVALSSGSYYLALSIKDTSRVACKYQLNLFGRAYLQDRDSTSAGFLSNWGTAGSSQPAVASIYASYIPN